jgi:hypothetical protein
VAGYLPNPSDPCGCPICTPTPDAGVPVPPPVCPLVPCPPQSCPGVFEPNPDPCGCPICAPILCPPCPALMGTCVGGVQPNPSDPCGCPICGSICPPCQIPTEPCEGGYVTNPAPCGCPICAPLSPPPPPPYCGDGNVDTVLGELCDMGLLNGVCVDANGNPVSVSLGNSSDTSCPAGTFVLCSALCQPGAVSPP